MRMRRITGHASKERTRQTMTGPRLQRRPLRKLKRVRRKVKNFVYVVFIYIVMAKKQQPFVSGLFTPGLPKSVRKPKMVPRKVKNFVYVVLIYIVVAKKQQPFVSGLFKPGYFGWPKSLRMVPRKVKIFVYVVLIYIV